MGLARVMCWSSAQVFELTYNYGRENYTKGDAYTQVALGTDDVYKTAEQVGRLLKFGFLSRKLLYSVVIVPWLVLCMMLTEAPKLRFGSYSSCHQTACFGCVCR